MTRDPIFDASDFPEDRGLDMRLRPRSFDEFVGQRRLVDNLAVYIQAARERAEPLDHLLFSGLPGLGKTTLSYLIAGEMGTELKATSGPALVRPRDLAGILTNLSLGDILFIDEIHRLPTVVEEYLYSAMEEFTLDIVLDQGPAARSIRIDLKPFTMIGATTREGQISGPLRSRFGVNEKLEMYPADDLEVILTRSAERLGVTLEPAAGAHVARMSRGTPRVANRFLKRLRDFAQIEADNVISEVVADSGLERLGIDAFGLTPVDRKILATIVRSGGTPVGLKTIAVSVGEEEQTIEDVYEPFLIRQGYLLKTPRGRTATPTALEVVPDAAPAPPGDLFGASCRALAALSALLPLFACASDSPPPPDRSPPERPPTIRVLLRKASARADTQVEAAGRVTLQENATGREVASGPSLRRKARDLHTYGDVWVVPESGRLRVDGVRYPGRLRVRPVESGRELILETDLESYLPGVLAGELTPSFPAAALRAQAIASRTYALHKIENPLPDREWDLADDTSSQMFNGLVSDPSSVLRKAVEDTRGMVLLWSSRPLCAYFSSTCGGHTAPVDAVFGGERIPPLTGTACAYCRISSRYEWERKLSAEEAGRLLELGGPVRSAAIEGRRPDGRVETLRFTGARSRSFPAHEARMRLGPNRFLSTAIDVIQVSGGRVLIRGRGWGHGVGMCQMGASGMAQAGAGAADILLHYYPGAGLFRLY